MGTSTVRIDHRSDGVAVLTIDQPDSKVNVLTEPLWTDFEIAIDSIAGRSDVKGLVIASAKPGVFIAGADLKLLANAPGPNDPAVKAFIEQGLRVLEKLEALPFPTCAAIDGAALGGGLEVALACDTRVLGTHSKVRLGLPEVTLGLTPGWGGTQRLSRVVEEEYLPTVLEMMVTGTSIDAETAFDIGLADSIVADSAELMEFARFDRYLGQRDRLREKRKQRLKHLEADPYEAFGSPSGYSVASSEAVRVMIEGAPLPLYDAIKLETAAFLRLAGSPESKRLIAEFFASRKR